MPEITLKYQNTVLKRYPIGIGQSLSIGRNESNDVVIDNLAVSSKHARIESISASRFILKDLQSTNGTFVNEKLISAQDLRNNDVILIGKHTLIFDRSDLDQKVEKKTAETLDEKTRFLDTAQFRELLEKAQESPQSKPAPKKTEAPPPGNSGGGLLTRIWRFLFG